MPTTNANNLDNDAQIAHAQKELADNVRAEAKKPGFHGVVVIEVFLSDSRVTGCDVTVKKKQRF